MFDRTLSSMCYILTKLSVGFFSALVKQNLRLDIGRCSSQSFYVIARESAEVAGPLTGTNVPSVVAFFHHVYRVSFFQLELVFVLWSIIVESSVSEI